ncbi:unnamed protein product, partial [Musa acuminata subsp. burmannicoides]
HETNDLCSSNRWEEFYPKSRPCRSSVLRWKKASTQIYKTHSKRQTIQKDVYDTTPHSFLRNRRLYLLPTAIGRPAGPSRDLENCLVSSGLISIGSDWSPSAIFSSSRLILLTWLWIRTCCSSPTPSCPPLAFRSSSPSIAACCSTRPRRRRR